MSSIFHAVNSVHASSSAPPVRRVRVSIMVVLVSLNTLAANARIENQGISVYPPGQLQDREP